MYYNLVVVDAQYDFAHKDGSLYVPGAEECVKKIIDFIEKHRRDIVKVIFTMDNHPTDHCSLKANGGPWPNHCMQGTEGQKVLAELIEACEKNMVGYKFLKKGEKPDVMDYTAFANSRKVGYATILKSSTDTLTVYNDQFVVCGFAGDYCVKDSIADLIKVVGAENIKVFRDGVADIDDGTTFNNFIKENNLTIINI
jgi:nicotinamidase-related amidase